MFMGEYNHSIDQKGRIIVPAKFREELGEEFVMTLGLDGCLFVYPNSEWETFVEQLKKLPGNREVRQLQRYFLAGATNCELDKQGRILIPSNLRDFAALEKDVVLIGVGGRVEIWDKTRYEGAATYDDMDEVTSHMTELGFII